MANKSSPTFKRFSWIGPPTKFTGRNGTFLSVGIEVTVGHVDCLIQPITSKGKIGNCGIVIPYEPHVLMELSEFFAELGNLALELEGTR